MHAAASAPDPETVLAAARHAAREWGETEIATRTAHLRRLRLLVTRERAAIADRICAEAGKTRAEALISDLLPTLEMIRYLEKNTGRILRPQKRRTPFIYGRCRSHVDYHPRGVVLVIGPWNNPFQLALVPVVSALAAGNAVILKPSERSPETGGLVRQLCNRAGIPDDAVQVVSGAGDTAQALINARPDLVFFTGGTRNGRAVLETAAEHLIPVTLELGGNDPMIVFADADLPRAVQAVLYGAFAHAGQHCVSTKRLYVESSVYDAFCRQLTQAARELTRSGAWGRVVDERAAEHANAQVRDALDRGASSEHRRVGKEGGPARRSRRST